MDHRTNSFLGTTYLGQMPKTQEARLNACQEEATNQDYIITDTTAQLLGVSHYGPGHVL